MLLHDITSSKMAGMITEVREITCLHFLLCTVSVALMASFTVWDVDAVNNILVKDIRTNVEPRKDNISDPKLMSIAEKPKQFLVGADGRGGLSFCEVLWGKSVLKNDMILALVGVVTGGSDKCKDCRKKCLPGLENGTYDVLNTPVYRSLTKRNDKIDYLYPHNFENLCFIVRKPPPLQYSVMTTVSFGMWLSICIILLLVNITITWLYKMPFGKAVLDVFEAAITGSFNTELRAVMLWVSVLSIVISNTIAGCFTGLMLSPATDQEINTLEQVAKHITEYRSSDDLTFAIDGVKATDGVAAEIAKKYSTSRFLYTTRLPYGHAVIGSESVLSVYVQQEDGFVNGVTVYHRVKSA